MSTDDTPNKTIPPAPTPTALWVHEVGGSVPTVVLVGPAEAVKAATSRLYGWVELSAPGEKAKTSLTLEVDVIAAAITTYVEANGTEGLPDVIVSMFEPFSYPDRRPGEGRGDGWLDEAPLPDGHPEKR